jgi:hypothetical protein
LQEFVTQETQAKIASAAAAIAASAPKPDAQNANAGPADDSFLSGVTVVGLAIGIIIGPFLAKRFKGMSVGEVVATVFELISHSIGFAVELIAKLVKKFTGKKAIPLPDK